MLIQLTGLGLINLQSISYAYDLHLTMFWQPKVVFWSGLCWLPYAGLRLNAKPAAANDARIARAAKRRRLSIRPRPAP